jgi:N-acetylglucosaminyldiphosphoundecaprenol N-acetyl-beta-D-mannosaminyltransferase
VDILGVGVHSLDMRRAVQLIDGRLCRKEKGYVCAADVNVIMEATRDRRYMEILNSSFLTVPDGMPTVWLGRLKGNAHMSRVCGPDLMLAVCEMSQSKGYTHYLLGGKEGVAETLKARLLARFSGLKIVGTYTPPFRPLNAVETDSLISKIKELTPDIIWVGLGAPKQERFMAEYLDRLDTTLMFGVGAAFDYHSGQKKEAPKWMQNAGLQWLHRLAQEPGRLGKRYLVNNPRFVQKVLCQLLSRK